MSARTEFTSRISLFSRAAPLPPGLGRGSPAGAFTRIGCRRSDAGTNRHTRSRRAVPGGEPLEAYLLAARMSLSGALPPTCLGEFLHQHFEPFAVDGLAQVVVAAGLRRPVPGARPVEGGDGDDREV